MIDELIRSRMHEALDVEQPGPDLRSRVIHSLPEPSKAAPQLRRPGLRWAGGLIAALLVVAVLAGVLYLGSVLHWRNVPANPATHFVPRATSGMVSATAGWQGGLGLPLLRTTDGGAHWSDVSPPSDCCADTTSMYLLDATHAWLANSGGTVLRTADGGATWDHGEAVPYTGYAAPSLYFVDATHGWMLFPDTGPANADALYRTNDGGLHWTLIATNPHSGTGCNWLTPAFASARDGWLPVDSCTSQSLLVTHDGGATWSPQQLPLAAAGLKCPCTSMALTVFDGNRAAVLVAGSGGAANEERMFTTADGGSSWTPVPLPGEFQFIVDFVDLNHGWAVAGPATLFSRDSNGQFPTFPGITVPLYRTDNGGQTWVTVNTDLAFTNANGRLSDMYFIDERHGFALRQLLRDTITSPVSQLLKSDDAGLTWTVVGPYP